MTAVQDQVDDPDMKIFTDAANAAADAGHPRDGRVWEPLGKAYSAIVGGADPTTTMEAAGKTINKAIAASSRLTVRTLSHPGGRALSRPPTGAGPVPTALSSRASPRARASPMTTFTWRPCVTPPTLRRDVVRATTSEHWPAPAHM